MGAKLRFFVDDEIRAHRSAIVTLFVTPLVIDSLFISIPGFLRVGCLQLLLDRLQISSRLSDTPSGAAHKCRNVTTIAVALASRQKRYRERWFTHNSYFDSTRPLPPPPPLLYPVPPRPPPPPPPLGGPRPLPPPPPALPPPRYPRPPSVPPPLPRPGPR
jgi:hypothetical protein